VEPKHELQLRRVLARWSRCDRWPLMWTQAIPNAWALQGSDRQNYGSRSYYRDRN
jgi:hypothetical protein